MQKHHLGQLNKIVVNVGLGRLSSQPGFADKILPEIIKEVGSITGQKPAPRAAKKSIATFKLRAGTVIGLQVTLRHQRMIKFLEKLNHAVFPRIRDFRGIDLKKVDADGNLNVGIREYIVFPEVKAEMTNVNFGVQITIVPKRIKSREAAIELYRQLGVPLQKK